MSTQTRAGRTFKRCTKCKGQVSGKRCEACGHPGVTWAFRIDVSRPGAPRRQVQRQGFATKAEALEAMAELQSDARDGRAVERNGRTVEQYLSEWLETRRPPVMSENGWATAEVHVRHHLAPALGGIRLQDLDAMDVEAFYSRLRTEGGRAGTGLSEATVKRIHTTLRSALGKAAKAKLIRSNPAVDAYEPPSEATRSDDDVKRRAWTTEQRSAFLAWARNNEPAEWFTAWTLLATTGLRRAEAANLRWSDVDLEARTLRVTKGKSRTSRRTVKLGAGVTEVLRRWKVDGDDGDQAGGVVSLQARREAADGDGFVFRVQRLDSWTQRWGRVMARATATVENDDGDETQVVPGLPRIRLHDLRHTAATLAVQAGIPAEVVSARLGHSRVAFTLDTYYEHSVSDQDEAADVLDVEVI